MDSGGGFRSPFASRSGLCGVECERETGVVGCDSVGRTLFGCRIADVSLDDERCWCSGEE